MYPASQTTLANKTIMVTGSSSGIGRAMAVEMARRGANVLLHGKSASEHLQSVQSEIESAGGNALTLHCDFTQTDSLTTFVDAAWTVHDGIDAWVNNAGGDVLTGDWPSRSLEEKLNFLWNVDVVATLLLSRLVGQKMIERFEQKLQLQSKPEKTFAAGAFSIINIGWDQAEHGMADENGQLFATTKGAIMAMSRSLAQSLAPAVRVNCLAPGWIQTKWGQSTSEYWDARAKAESLMGRWGFPEDIAAAAAFLCSDDASFIAGQIIPINGGFARDSSL